MPGSQQGKLEMNHQASCLSGLLLGLSLRHAALILGACCVRIPVHGDDWAGF